MTLLKENRDTEKKSQVEVNSDNEHRQKRKFLKNTYTYGFLINKRKNTFTTVGDVS